MVTCGIGSVILRRFGDPSHGKKFFANHKLNIRCKQLGQLCLIIAYCQLLKRSSELNSHSIIFSSTLLDECGTRQAKQVTDDARIVFAV